MKYRLLIEQNTGGTMRIDYGNQAAAYEETRAVEPLVYSTLCSLLSPEKSDTVLDFGCGTGNYLKKLILDFEIKAYGIEPSSAMRKIATEKLGETSILRGDHLSIPFPELYFNKIYCTDVIHHVRQLDAFFLNLIWVAKTGARLCICTESPPQLAEKYWIKYFPDALAVDLERFHSVNSIILAGENSGWTYSKSVLTEEEQIAPISSSFLKRVEKKTLSVFHLIADESFKLGLARMKADYHAGTPILQHEGYTFVLFEKRK